MASKSKAKAKKDIIRDTMTATTDWLRTGTELGLALILAFVTIDVLFPGTTGVVNNLGVIVGQFSKEGIAGLIALLMFLIVFRGHKED
ncbi:MAG: hypothetical protein OEZ33_10845 [Gammaproteobacteria bacterium]|nr:hypothetical protein [Gammaproteobacteria bacterium]MDH5778699.1 hypothetical protein [Gammaproteobacteria bacterium]